MNKLMKTLTVATALLFLNGCAYMIRGSEEDVLFTSIPEGAKVELGNGLGCETTPCSITVPRKINSVATFKKEKCETKTTTVQGTYKQEGVLLLVGNLVLNAGLGFIVDMVTGAGQDIHPNPVSVDLDCN